MYSPRHLLTGFLCISVVLFFIAFIDKQPRKQSPIWCTFVRILGTTTVSSLNQADGALFSGVDAVVGVMRVFGFLAARTDR